MRTTQITVTVYGPDPKKALERLFSDLLDVVDADAQVPLTVQVRVAQSAALHAPDPPPLDRLGAQPDVPDERYIAEAKLWAWRTREPRAPRLGGHTVFVALPPSSPSDDDAEDDEPGAA